MCAKAAAQQRESGDDPSPKKQNNGSLHQGGAEKAPLASGASKVKKRKGEATVGSKEVSSKVSKKKKSKTEPTGPSANKTLLQQAEEKAMDDRQKTLQSDVDPDATKTRLAD